MFADKPIIEQVQEMIRMAQNIDVKVESIMENFQVYHFGKLSLNTQDPKTQVSSSKFKWISQTQRIEKKLDRKYIGGKS